MKIKRFSIKNLVSAAVAGSLALQIFTGALAPMTASAQSQTTQPAIVQQSDGTAPTAAEMAKAAELFGSKPDLLAVVDATQPAKAGMLSAAAANYEPLVTSVFVAAWIADGRVAVGAPDGCVRTPLSVDITGGVTRPRQNIAVSDCSKAFYDKEGVLIFGTAIEVVVRYNEVEESRTQATFFEGRQPVWVRQIQFVQEGECWVVEKGLVDPYFRRSFYIAGTDTLVRIDPIEELTQSVWTSNGSKLPTDHPIYDILVETSDKKDDFSQPRSTYWFRGVVNNCFTPQANSCELATTTPLQTGRPLRPAPLFMCLLVSSSVPWRASCASITAPSPWITSLSQTMWQ
ncbi:MAG: hypothetical protein U0525_03620 [Patescibacteria group bacterium]